MMVMRAVEIVTRLRALRHMCPERILRLVSSEPAHMPKLYWHLYSGAENEENWDYSRLLGLVGASAFSEEKVTLG
jgi:hypothetical protein